MITVHGFSTSGNCHKVRLLLEQLNRDYRWVEVDSSKGETRTADFLARNPNGRVPIIELDDGRILAESNAIVFWLAEGTSFLPGDSWQKAQALAWMFFEQYSHEPYIAVARFIRGWTAPDSPRRRTARCLERGHRRGVMERHLSANPGALQRYALPTSRCSPTPTSPQTAVSTWPRILRSAIGWRACARRPGSWRCRRPTPKRLHASRDRTDRPSPQPFPAVGRGGEPHERRPQSDRTQSNPRAHARPQPRRDLRCQLH